MSSWSETEAIPLIGPRFLARRSAGGGSRAPVPPVLNARGVPAPKTTRARHPPPQPLGAPGPANGVNGFDGRHGAFRASTAFPTGNPVTVRSEERRVGKEGRS